MLKKQHLLSYLIGFMFFISSCAIAENSYYSHLPHFVKRLALYSVKGKQDARLFLNKNTMNKRLLTKGQQKILNKQYMSRFFAPWRKKSSTNHLPINYAKRFIRSAEISHFQAYKRNLGYGENFHHHSRHWLYQIKLNANLKTFPNTNRAAIATDNAYVRLLPTTSPHFGNHNTAGEGYPFDDFQISVVWVGTPLHILHVTKNGDWAYVITPSVQGWIKTKDFAYVDNSFIKTWKSKTFAATIVDHFPVKNQHQLFHFTAYMGSILPISSIHKNKIKILIPLKNVDGNALIRSTEVSTKQMGQMPYPLTKRHIALFINQQLGIPYGWGGLYFYGDCSSTLKSLFTPFGIWLPRNSKSQAHAYHFMSLEKFNEKQRREAILRYGKPFITLISVTGHIMLYLGERHGQIITFQNVWALASLASTGQEGRSVIGKAVIMPLKMRYGSTGLFPQIMADQLGLTFLGYR